MLRFPFLKHFVQVYIVAQSGLNFINVLLVKYMLPLTKCLLPL